MERTPLGNKNSQQTHPSQGRIRRSTMRTSLPQLKENAVYENSGDSSQCLYFSETDVTSTPMVKLIDKKTYEKNPSHLLLVSPISHEDSSEIGSFLSGNRLPDFVDGTDTNGFEQQLEDRKSKEVADCPCDSSVQEFRKPIDDGKSSILKPNPSLSSNMDSGYVTTGRSQLTYGDIDVCTPAPSYSRSHRESFPLRIKAQPLSYVDDETDSNCVHQSPGALLNLRQAVNASCCGASVLVEDASKDDSTPVTPLTTSRSHVDESLCLAKPLTRNHLDVADWKTPLQISIPHVRYSDGPSTREKMFLALDKDFQRSINWMSKSRYSVGKYLDEPQLDIISCLDDYDSSGYILSECFLPFLNGCDLRRMRSVCWRWRNVVTKFGRSRWKRYQPLKRLGKETGVREKENVPDRPSPCCSFCDGPGDRRGFATPPALDLSRRSFGTPCLSPDCGVFLRRGPLRCTQRFAESPASGTDAEESRPATPRERFLSASTSLLSSEHLRRCPHCGGPSRIHPGSRRARCMDTTCAFDYCTFCLYKFHNGTPCRRRISPTREPKPKSPEKRLQKKMLKRL